MGCLFFELYFHTLKRISKCKGKCRIYKVNHNKSVTRDFIKLYHGFGIYWSQKDKKLVNNHIYTECQRVDLGGDQFIAQMKSLKKDFVDHFDTI